MNIEYNGICWHNNGQFYISYYNKNGSGVFKPIYADKKHKHYFMITKNTRQYLSAVQENDLIVASCASI